MMIALLLLSVAGLAALIVLVMFAYGAWIAHHLTLQERMPVSGHPMQLGLPWEDVAFPSRGDAVPLVGWYLPAPGDSRCRYRYPGDRSASQRPGNPGFGIGP